ncbi:MAG: 50S ribosomal protein L30 [Bdellovibrionota bacterium]
MAKTFKVTLLRSTIGCTVTQKETVRCLGLRRIRHTVSVNDTPANRGQIYKVQHLVDVQVEK